MKKHSSTCCEMAPQRSHLSPSSLTAFVMMRMSSSIFPLWVWRYMKRMTVRGRGQSQQRLHVRQKKHLRGPKPPEKKAVIYFDVTRIKRVHVTNCRGTLIMLSEEDGRMLSPSAETARHAGIKPTCACLSPATQSSARCFSHRFLGERKREGARGGVAFWKES